MKFLIMIIFVLCFNVNAKTKKTNLIIEHFASKESVRLKLNDAFTEKILQLDQLVKNSHMDYVDYLTSTEFLKISQNAVNELYSKVEKNYLNDEKDIENLDSRVVEYLSEVSYFAIFLDAHVGSFQNSTFTKEGILEEGEYKEIYKSTQRKIIKMMWLLLQEDGATKDIGYESIEEYYEEFGID